MVKTNNCKLKPEHRNQVSQLIENILIHSEIPGISIAIDVNGESLEVALGKVDTRSVHPMTVNTHFKLGCFNKLLIALVVLKLVEDKSIKLDQAISHYLPSLSGKNGNVITIKHLLSHTAGFQGENTYDLDIIQGYSFKIFTESFNQRPSLFKPGEMFDYSHSSSIILGEIIKTVTGENPEKLIKKLIFHPLGIKTLTYSETNLSICANSKANDINPSHIIDLPKIQLCDFWTISISNAWISMNDLVKIGVAITAKSSIFSHTIKDHLLQPVVRVPDLLISPRNEHNYNYFGLGCGRFRSGNHGIHSNSSGQSIALHIDVCSGIVVAVGINSNDTYIRDFIISKLFHALFMHDEPIISEYLPPLQSDLIFESLVGTYFGAEHYSYNIEIEAGKLALRIGHNPFVEHNTSNILAYFIKNKQGNIIPVNSKLHNSIGFFKKPDSRVVFLILGGNIFVREIDFLNHSC